MIDGYVHPRYAALAHRFERLYRKRKHGGGALAAYHRGEKVLDVWTGWSDVKRGRRWREDTMALSFSTTKGVASTLLHRLAEKGRIQYDAPVADYWPEFAAAGKAEVTVRQVMTHSAGLHGIRKRIRSHEEMLDHRHMASILAREAPRPRPGAAPGYHGLTYGWLVAAIVENVTGDDVRDVLQRELAEPLGTDGLYFGAPADERDRIATLFPGILPGGMSVDALGRRVERMGRLAPFADALLVDGFEDIIFDPQGRVYDTAMPAANGVFTARSLAKMYAALANEGRVNGTTLLQPETVKTIGRVQRRERDYVLGLSMRWRLGYHQAFVAGKMQPKAFGHFGFGGSGAWADPETGLALAFVTNRLGNATTPVGDTRLARLGAAALKIVRDED